MPVLGPLQLDLLLKQPPNIKEYCIEWLKRYSKFNTTKITQLMMTPKNYSAIKNQMKFFRRDAGSGSMAKGGSGKVSPVTARSPSTFFSILLTEGKT
jgi:hypothetical protein